jgi:SSS family solute:Na+ symporter
MLVPFVYSYIISKNQVVTGDDWVVGGRDLPTYVIVGTQFASAMGGGVLVALVTMGYASGLSAVTYGTIASLPFFILMLVGPWIRESKLDTIPDILLEFYGEHKGIAILGAFFSLIVPFGWITAQLGAFGQMYSPITGFSIPALTIGISIISLFFIMPSGLKTVAWTDFIFAVFMILVCIITLFYGFNLAGGVSAVFNSADVIKNDVSIPSGFFSVGGVTILLWLFSVLPGATTNQIYYQRISSIRDPKKVNISLGISAVALIAACTWAYLIGTIVRSMNPALKGGNGATAWFMTQLPTWLLTIFAGLVCATIMSTVSSAAQTCVTNITKDIYKRSINPQASDKDIVKMARVFTVIIMALSTALSLVFPEVLGWLVYTYAFSAAGLAAPIFIGFITRKTKPFTAQSVFIAMIVAMIVCIIAKQTNSFGTKLPFAFYGLIANGVTMVISSKIKPKIKNV